MTTAQRGLDYVAGAIPWRFFRQARSLGVVLSRPAAL